MSEETKIINAPDRIWLQVGDDFEPGDIDFNTLSEITWCQDTQGDLDIEYVRADVVTADPEPHVREKLPAIVKTPQGKRLYSMAYERGRRRERLNASGHLRPAPRNVASAESLQRELRVILPEGGYANLFWPEKLTADSAQMLSEMFSTAMQAFARAATAKIAAAPTESK